MDFDVPPSNSDQYLWCFFVGVPRPTDDLNLLCFPRDMPQILRNQVIVMERSAHKLSTNQAVFALQPNGGLSQIPQRLGIV